MKIIFLCKRRPQGKDLLTRPYGRFFYLPHLMSNKGHEVFALLLSYKNEEPISITQAGITWVSESIFPNGPFSYLSKVSRFVRDIRPDWIVGFSDTYYGILSERLGRKFGIGCVVDAYDNYESYLPWCKPLHMYWRKAISGATVVTAAGPYLARFLKTFRPNGNVTVVPMAVDPGFFEPKEQSSCRRELGLPLDKKLVGYCGSLFHSRGIEVLFHAYALLKREDPNIELVISGRRQRGVLIPAGVRYLGYLPDAHMSKLMNSMDVLTVVNRSSNFGNYSYPVKLYEAMQCKIPVVATRTPATTWVLGNRAPFLAKPEDPVDLSLKIKGLIQLGRIDYGKINTWEDSCLCLEQALFASSKR